MTAIILCSEKNTEFESPISLIEINGQSILEIIFNNLIKHKVENIIIVTAYQAKQIQKFIHRKFKKQKVTFFHNKKFNTVKNSQILNIVLEKYVPEDVLVLNDNCIFDNKLLENLKEDSIVLNERDEIVFTRLKKYIGHFSFALEELKKNQIWEKGIISLLPFVKFNIIKLQDYKNNIIDNQSDIEKAKEIFKNG